MSAPVMHPASYRDPSGFVFYHDGVLYRQVNQSFKEHFEAFTSSGLYQQLAQEKLLISHTVIPQNLTGDLQWYITLLPEKIPVVTYPFEWCFDFLKDAALLTLTLAEMAMQKNMMLKDASPYNVQLHNGKPVFIDTLSFEILDATKPWIAYRQFCEAFLAPLAVMHFLKTPLQPLLLAYPEGLPLQTAKKMLPLASKFHVGCYLHLHLHGQYSETKGQSKKMARSFTKEKFARILQSLKQTVASFNIETKTGWAGYYNEAAQRQGYLEQKQKIITTWINSLPQLKTALDVGANEGLFAELFASKHIYTIAADSDHFSINALYRRVKKEGLQNLVPVISDLANPGPAIGVDNEERASFTTRMKSDIVVVLAVLHHLCIGRNIPFAFLARFFKKLGTFLLIEFVPKEDEKIKEMLINKKDIYDWYTPENFEAAFQEHFHIRQVQKINGSNRTLFLMQQHEA